MAYTTVDNPELYFQTKLYTGNGSAQSFTLDGSENMQPDWVWIKPRSFDDNHILVDSVRGTNKILRSNLVNAESTLTTMLTSFDSDGFTTGGNDNVTRNSETFVAWNWKASGSTSSDSNGSITSTISANTTAVFSIVTYTGTGSNATVGHGLGAVPQMIIVKNRDGGTDNWAVYHGELGKDKWLKLNTSDASATDTVMWNDTTPTSSVFSVGTYTNSNGNTNGMLAYCFSEKQGYSKFGSYEGNGNADGPFIYTGFKPAFVMCKSIDTTSNWNIFDNKRSTFNDVDDYIKANANAAEDTGSSDIQMDFLSNGFKIKGNNDEVNGSETFIYMTVAESPFVNSNGVPTNAR